MTIEELYQNALQPGPYTDDIREHLTYLRDLASRCDHVTEFGFRTGTSFTAFLAAQPKKLVTYDIQIPDAYAKALNHVKGRTKVEFNEKSTLEATIDKTDLLFIDTLHTYTQLKKELDLHADKAQKFIAFHDTESYKLKGEDGSTPGLWDAIVDFLETNKNWSIHRHFSHNNGLTVLCRN